MTKLDVINNMLATMGETPLNQLDEDHPFVAAGLRALAAGNRKLQSRGWWFNSEMLTLTPDDSGFIYLPGDVLSAESCRGWKNQYTQRGRRLYDLINGSFIILDNPVYVDVIREIPFEDLPATAAEAVAAYSVLQYQINYDADAQRTQVLSSLYTEAIRTLGAEDIRQERPNFLQGVSVGPKLAAISPIGTPLGRLPTYGFRRR